MSKVTVRELEFEEAFQLTIEHSSVCHVRRLNHWLSPNFAAVVCNCRQLWGSLRLDLRAPSIPGC